MNQTFHLLTEVIYIMTEMHDSILESTASYSQAHADTSRYWPVMVQRILWATMSLASNWALAIINSCSWRAINGMRNFLSESSMRCSYVTGGRANKAYYGLTVMIRSLHGRRKCFRIVASTANRDTVVETRTSRVRRRPSIANIISFPIDHLGCSLIARAKIS